jgi:hypothetical protein
MSFLVDPPLLVAAGAAIGRAGADEKTARRAEGAVLAVFLVTSVSLYANARWTRPIWRLCRARSGRDWMVNSGVFSLETDPVTTRRAVAAVALFATYPAFLRLGRRLAR